MREKKKFSILVAVSFLTVFGLFGFKLANISDNTSMFPIRATVPGVSCSGAFFGTVDTTDTADITAAEFLARFPSPKKVTSVTGIAKIYETGLRLLKT